jgi:serine/threonine-protein kinase
MSIHEVAGIREGDILAGKYRVERLLGVGGMGAVVAAQHIQLEDRVAIKFLLPEVRERGDAVMRFLREARAAVKIKSPHVARVTDVGTFDNGLPYMVMEYLEGSDLDRWLTEQGPLPIAQACELVLQACEAIAEAHALGIVHRDLKPANLFVVRRPDGSQSVKVLDFGISKMPQSTTGVGLTRTAVVMGSPMYMSPEQIESTRDVDARSDIWALGVILYELVTGAVPFDGSQFAELAMQIITQPPKPLRDRCAHAPPGFEQVVLKCLEKQAANRFQSVAELAAQLAPFAPPRAQRSVSVIAGVLKVVTDPPPQAASPLPVAPVGTVHVPGRNTVGAVPRNRFALVAGAITFLLLAIGGLVALQHEDPEPAAGQVLPKRPEVAAVGDEIPVIEPPVQGQSGAITGPEGAGNSGLAQPRVPAQAVPATEDKREPASAKARRAPAPAVAAPKPVQVAPVAPSSPKEQVSPWGGRL